MNRTGAGGWLLSLFFAAKLSARKLVRRRNPAVMGMQGSALLRCYSLFAGCYQHLLSEKDQPRPRVARYQSDNVVRLTYYF
jgi:hypothetical protein